MKKEMSLRQFLLAPFMGLLFAIFLPAIGIGMLFYFTGLKLFNEMTKLSTFGWRPSEAYLAGRKNEKNKKEDK